MHDHKSNSEFANTHSRTRQSKFKAFAGTGYSESVDEWSTSPITKPGLFAMVCDAVAKELGYDYFVESFANDESYEFESSADSETDHLSREDTIDMLTLMLLYLTSWTERGSGKQGSEHRQSRKSADWSAIDRLREYGFISCTNEAKSATITEDGEFMAKELLDLFALEHLE